MCIASLFWRARVGAIGVDDSEARGEWARGGLSALRTLCVTHFWWARSGHESRTNQQIA